MKVAGCFPRFFRVTAAAVNPKVALVNVLVASRALRSDRLVVHFCDFVTEFADDLFRVGLMAFAALEILVLSLEGKS